MLTSQDFEPVTEEVGGGGDGMDELGTNRTQSSSTLGDEPEAEDPAAKEAEQMTMDEPAAERERASEREATGVGNTESSARRHWPLNAPERVTVESEEARIGLGRTVALYHRASTPYQIF